MLDRLMIAWLLMVVCTASSAEVYRWTDEQGNVIFSDTSRPGAEKIELNETTVVPALRIQRRTERRSPAAAPGYTSVSISSPANEQTLRNTQGVPVAVVVAPKLLAAHQLQLYLDGKPTGAPQASTSFMLNEVERGSHTLQVAVLDGQGKELQRSPASTFFLHQRSIQHPPPANPGPSIN